jgi:hypothetical protein
VSWLVAVLALAVSIGSGTCRAAERAANPRAVYVSQACLDAPLAPGCMP